MKLLNPFEFTLVAVVAFAFPLAAAERCFGEPVQLKRRAIYFTSWKYIRQGNFTWRMQVDPNAATDVFAIIPGPLQAVPNSVITIQSQPVYPLGQGPWSWPAVTVPRKCAPPGSSPQRLRH